MPILSFAKRFVQWLNTDSRTAPVQPGHPSASKSNRDPADVYNGGILAYDDEGNIVLEDVPRYPPYDHGLPAISTASLMASQVSLIKRIRRDATLDDLGTSVGLADSAIQRFGRYVHLLPATQNQYFYGAGGLLRLGLEVGFYTLQSSGGAVFSSRETAKSRNENDPKWRLAAMLGGMCGEVYRAVSNVVVVNERGEEWPPFMTPLADWLEKTESKRFYLRWQQNPTLRDPHMAQALSAFLVANIISAETLDYLATDNRHIITAMLACITGSVRPGDPNPLAKLIHNMRLKVIERDVNLNPNHYGKPQLGLHFEPYLIDAMRRLIRSGVWKINEQKARLWVGNDGAFLIWKTAANEIGQKLLDDGITGVPRDADTLAEILMHSGLLQPTGTGGQYWEIWVADDKSLPAVKLTDLRVIADEELLEEMGVAPLDRAMLMSPAMGNSLTNNFATKSIAQAMQDLAKPTASQPAVPESIAQAADVPANPAAEQTAQTEPEKPKRKRKPAKQKEESEAGGEASEDHAGTETLAVVPPVSQGDEVEDAEADAEIPTATPETNQSTSGCSSVAALRPAPVEAPAEPSAPFAAIELDEKLQRAASTQMSRFKPVVAAWLEALADDILEGNVHAIRLPEGIAVPVSAIEAGMPKPSVIAILYQESVLHIPPGQTKKTVELNSAEHFILKTGAAKLLLRIH